MRAVSTAFPATTLLRFLPSSPCPFDPRTWRKMLMGFGSARFSFRLYHTMARKCATVGISARGNV